MTHPRHFMSDNSAGIHPEILKAIAEASSGHVEAYGGDPYTARAVEAFRRHLGPGADIHFVFNGTAANVLGLQAMTRPYHAIFCADDAHIQLSECGAPERFTGAKLVPVPCPDGKLTPALIRARLEGTGDQHHVQPRVISIAQASERGLVYSPAEVRALADFAHGNGMYLHMDGARISNAAASLGTGLGELTGGAGVDVLSFGGTKAGLMCGEAVVIFNPELARDFQYLRKQGMQLASKMRFLAVQFEALLGGDLWLRNARHANAMARLLAEEVRRIPGIQLTRAVETNAVFAIVPPDRISAIRRKFAFHVWDPANSEVRWMAAYDTTEADVRAFADTIRQAMA